MSRLRKAGLSLFAALAFVWVVSFVGWWSYRIARFVADYWNSQ